MSNTVSTSLLRQLQRQHTATRDETALEHDAASTHGASAPTPVLLLTDTALYALRSGSSWSRLPLERVRRLSISTDPSGILTRYEVVDDAGDTWLHLAVAFARPAFAARLRDVVPMAVVHAPAPRVRRERAAATRLRVLGDRTAAA